MLGAKRSMRLTVHSNDIDLVLQFTRQLIIRCTVSCGAGRGRDGSVKQKTHWVEAFCSWIRSAQEICQGADRGLTGHTTVRKSPREPVLGVSSRPVLLHPLP